MFKKFDYDLIVIGGGSSGLTASVMASEMGLKTLLVEKYKIGGDCTHFGCVPSKTLIKAGVVARRFLDFEKYGLRLKDEHKKHHKNLCFDIDLVLKKVQDVVSEIYEKEEPKTLLEKFNFDIKIGEAYFLDKNRICINGVNVSSKKFIICSGSRAFVPDIKGLSKFSFMTNKDIFKPKKYKSITIIGGGVIGCEISEALNNLGIRVNLVHSKEFVLNKIDREIGEKITKKFREDKINLFLNKRFIELKEKNKKKVIVLKDKITNKIEEILSDEVLIAIGREPNILSLKLENANVKFNSNGILVNSNLRTNVKNIYACGDCINKNNYTHFANYSAKICILNMIFGNFFKYDNTTIPKSIFVENDISSVGFSKEELDNKKIKYILLKKEIKEIDRAITNSNKMGFLEIYVSKKGYVLGALFFGEGTSELIGEVTLLMKNKIKITKLSDTIHPYPTISYGLRNLCDDFRTKNFSPFKKKLLKILLKLTF